MFIYEGVMMRAIEEADLDFLAECRNNPETWKYLGNMDFTNKIKQADWFVKSSLAGDKANFVLCLEDGTKIGFIRTDEVDYKNRSIRVGGDIHPNFRGKGYGTKMYKMLLKFMFDYLGMHRVWLLVIGYNEIAQNLYSNMGFKREGVQREAIFRDGDYHDYYMYSILDYEWRNECLKE